MTAIHLHPVADDVARLAEPVATLDVWPGCVHLLSRAEAAMIASAPFQRLRRLRQMGLAFHAWPNAENTRASHSLGVAYWSATYLAALRRADDPATQAGLAAAETSADAEGLSLDLVVRLFALVHDIELLPLGHTLRYQSGLFGEPAGRPRLAACVAVIKAHAHRHAFREAATGAEREAWLAAFDRHLDAATGPGNWLAVELVNSGLGADLVDFALRDSFAITRPQAFPGGLPAAVLLVETGRGWGLALDVSDPATAPGRVALADDLYRARFEVFAASVFHPVKLAADAMLDLVLRRLGPDACRALLTEDDLLSMGDDELLDRLAEAEAPAARHRGGKPLGEALQAGRLHQEVWRTDNLEAFRRRSDADPARALSLDPGWRTEAESTLRSRLPWATDGDVIVAVSSPTMQAKPANARFVGPGATVFTLADASGRGFVTQAEETSRRYQGLWSLRVYLAPRCQGRADDATAAAQAVFG